MLHILKRQDELWNAPHWYFHCINSLRPRQNGRLFADDIFKWIFLNENVWIKISLKFIPQGPINNIPALVQIMVWRQPGDKPLFGPVMVRLPTHICVTRPQWVKQKCKQVCKFFLIFCWHVEYTDKNTSIYGLFICIYLKTKFYRLFAIHWINIV